MEEDLGVARPPSGKGKASLGVIVVLIAVSQVSTTELTRFVQTSGFNAPFFIMVIHAAMMAPCFVAGRTWERKDEKSEWSVGGLAQKTAWIFLMLYFGANYCYTRALALAPASWVQAVFGTAPALVTVLSRLWLGEPATWQRWLGVLGAVGGIAILAFSAETSSSTNGVGDLVLGLVLAQAATVCAACYKVMFKVTFGSPAPAFVFQFVGLLGFLAALVGLPVAGIFAATNVEDNAFRRLPSKVYIVLAVGGLLDVLYNSFIALGLALAESPVYVAVATVLATPLSAAVDLIFFDQQLTVFYVIGTLLVLVSFGIINTAPTSPPLTRWDDDDTWSLHSRQQFSRRIPRDDALVQPLHLGHDRSPTKDHGDDHPTMV